MTVALHKSTNIARHVSIFCGTVVRHRLSTNLIQSKISLPMSEQEKMMNWPGMLVASLKIRENKNAAMPDVLRYTQTCWAALISLSCGRLV